jgi:23S rRNA maturation-related 3'-5' exoribonuclease YhaM
MFNFLRQAFFKKRDFDSDIKEQIPKFEANLNELKHFIKDIPDMKDPLSKSFELLEKMKTVYALIIEETNEEIKNILYKEIIEKTAAFYKYATIMKAHAKYYEDINRLNGIS